METVLVTGGAGFIGSNIAEKLLSEGYAVIVLDDLSTGRRENIEHLLPDSKFKFIEGSILDSGFLRSIIKLNGVSLISHQAAIPSVEKSIIDPVKTIETNITGTTKLFDIAAECRCRRVVFASSCAVYGDGPGLPKREDMPLSPKSPYAVSKATKEMLARNFSTLFTLSIVGLRYFNVYGRRQDPASDYAAVIPKFIIKAVNDEAIFIEGDGLQTRDFVYIDDVVKANILALTTDALSGMCFNIACGERVGILELAEMIKKEAGSGSPIVHKPPRAGDIKDSLADIDSARRYLGYAPEFTIQRGLSETVNWYSEQYGLALGVQSSVR